VVVVHVHHGPDLNDASENDTSRARLPARPRYRLWLAVTTDARRAWIDEELVMQM